MKAPYVAQTLVSAASTLVSRRFFAWKPLIFRGPARMPTSLQQTARTDLGKQQDVHMIRHYDKRAWIVIRKGNTAVQRGDDNASNGRLAQEERPCRGAIQMAIHPDKSLPGGCFTRRWIVAVRKAAVQMPGEKQPSAWRVRVGQTAA